MSRNQLTESYSSFNWHRLTQSWTVTMYLTHPGSEKPLDLPTNTYSSETKAAQRKSFDETMEEVLEERAEAWERLATL